jgi:hypothetical protein
MASLPRVRRRLPIVVSVLTAAVLSPAVAQASPRAQPLVDLAPTVTKFKDRVLHSSSRRGPLARAAADTAKFTAYPTKQGYSVAVAVSSRYTNPDPAIAQSYVDFLDSLPHSTELAKLGVYIAPADEVTATCGGLDGTLACYDSGSHIMVVPGEQTTTTTGVTTSYVVTHEYGHHIAALRSNDPFNAFTTGPKYWASYEMVCDKAGKGILFPGDEAAHYFSNPGEGWAETYAHMKYRDQAWSFDPAMQPDEGAYAAAAKDIATPWTADATTVFRGRFGRGGRNTRLFTFNLSLDGALKLRLNGPARTNYNLAVVSNGGGGGSTKGTGSRASLSYSAACRTLSTEQVTVTVKRVRGSGPFTVRASYAG